MIFDGPDPELQSLPFEIRYHHLQNSSFENPCYVSTDKISERIKKKGGGGTEQITFLIEKYIIAPRLQCSDHVFINSVMRSLMAAGGEGIVLRQPGSLYFHGRTTFLIKLKVFISISRYRISLNKIRDIIHHT